MNIKYDPMGRRIQKSSTSGTVNYLYDGASVLEEVDGSGALVSRYTQGDGLDEPLATLRAGTTSYYEADGLGSVTSLSNSSGALANTYTYDSVGKLTGSSGTIVNSYRYTAREYDAETGLYYYRARYYDSNIGRFVSEDPIGFRGGNNFFAYVENNAVNLVDPSGLKLGTPQYCSRLLDRIQNIQRKIDERLGELDEDPGTLPESCPGDKLKPSLSRAGHRMLINIDKANLAAKKALYLAFCGNDPPGVPVAVPPPTPSDNYFDRRFWERTTGLTGGALIGYLIISEGSRLYPPRNLVPVP